MPDEAETSAKFIAVNKDIFNILTPKSCVQRITKTENVKKQLPKFTMIWCPAISWNLYMATSLKFESTIVSRGESMRVPKMYRASNLLVDL